jgi:hypothetical protein
MQLLRMQLLARRIRSGQMWTSFALFVYPGHVIRQQTRQVQQQTQNCYKKSFILLIFMSKTSFQNIENWLDQLLGASETPPTPTSTLHSPLSKLSVVFLRRTDCRPLSLIMPSYGLDDICRHLELRRHTDRILMELASQLQRLGRLYAESHVPPHKS